MPENIELRVGSSANIQTDIIVPESVDLSTFSIEWQLTGTGNDIGTLYQYGSDVISKVTVSGIHKIVSAQSILNIPHTIQADQFGTNFLLTWTLTEPAAAHTSAERLKIFPTIDEAGPFRSKIVSENTSTSFSAITDVEDVATVQIFRENRLLHTVNDVTSEIVGNDERHWSFSISAQNIGADPQLEAYNVLWTTRDNTQADHLYVYTPTMFSAMEELNGLINYVNTKFRLDDLVVDRSQLAAFLKVGADKFNATGLPTTFDMTAAASTIRYWWLMCSQAYALRILYLAEGMRSFNFSTQSISLDVDLTQYIESQASALESAIESGLPQLKQTLHKRGALGGDGSLGSIAPGRVSAAVGITHGPLVRSVARRHSRRFSRLARY